LASAYLPGRKISKNFKIVFRGLGTVYLANGICFLPVLVLIDIIMDPSVRPLIDGFGGRCLKRIVYLDFRKLKKQLSINMLSPILFALYKAY